MITNGPFVVESFVPLAHLTIITTLMIKRVSFETSLHHYEKQKISTNVLNYNTMTI
jgi:hypothetical protein